MIFNFIFFPIAKKQRRRVRKPINNKKKALEVFVEISNFFSKNTKLLKKYFDLKSKFVRILC